MYIFCVLLAFGLASCFSFPEATTEEAASGATSPLDTYWQTKSAGYPAGAAFKTPAPLKAGQFVVTGTTTNGRRQSVNRQLAVGKEGSGWIFETWSINDKGKEQLSQMRFDNLDAAIAKGDPSLIKIAWMKTKNADGTISEQKGKDLDLYNSMMQSAFAGMVLKVSTFTAGGSLTVPAGTFSGTNVQTSTTKVLLSEIEIKTWYNTAVPLSGIVKTMSTDGKTVTELLDFGTNGKPMLK
jgi:hypothetical protein